MNTDGSGKHNITNSPSWDSNAAWSPDGKKIAYSSDDQIVVANADGSDPHVLTHEGYNRYPVWSPNGRKIAFTQAEAFPGGNAGPFDIYVVNANGSGQVNLTRTRTAQEVDPSWSPDGRKIAFASGFGDETEVCVMRPNGTNRTRLTTNGQPDFNPAWSPDGTRIAFIRFHRLSAEVRSANIWVMNADGRSETLLSRGRQADYQPAWSPDGTRIAFTRGRKIWVMNANGRGLVNLGDNDGWYDTDADWSPNGRKILFERRDSLSDRPPSIDAPLDPPPPCGPLARCHVPRVVGLRLGTAQLRIRDAYCAVGRVRRIPSESVGRVISQYPQRGAVRTRGGKVNLVVGRGPRR